MNFIDIVKDVIEDDAVENLCKKSKAFAAFNKIQSILEFMVKNKIDPSSDEGKHCLLNLEFAANEFNQVFIEHGLNPQLRFNCNKIV